MKILYFNDFRLGILRGDDVVDVSGEVQDIPHTGPHDLISGLIARFEDYRERLEKAAADGAGISLKDVRIRPPLPRPGNIDCMAVNYMEDGTRSSPAPIQAFQKSPSAIIGQGDTMVPHGVPWRLVCSWARFWAAGHIRYYTAPHSLISSVPVQFSRVRARKVGLVQDSP